MKLCPICSKGSAVHGGYSNRTRATQFNPTGKRRRYPNLQWATFTVGGSQGATTASKPSTRRMKICTRCLKTNRQLTVAPKV